MKRKSFSFITLILSFTLLFVLQFAVQSVDAAEIPYVQKILDRGTLKVGLPPYTTPPFYYNDPKTGQLEGYDVEIAREFAAELGVEAVFDRDSSSFNDLVRRAGAGDFDIAIGKLGTTYKRMSDAHPHEYMNFRHAILSNRKSIASIQGNIPDEEFASVLLNSEIRIGFIANSAYDTYAQKYFPNAKRIGLKNWAECKKALFDGKVDGIYRDATEIKKIVYQIPSLSLDYVPVLFEDVIDQKSIYTSTNAEVQLGSILDYFLSREVKVQSDSQIMESFADYYRPDDNPKS